MARFRTLPDSDRGIEPRTLSDRTAVIFSFQFISQVATFRLKCLPTYQAFVKMQAIYWILCLTIFVHISRQVLFFFNKLISYKT